MINICLDDIRAELTKFITGIIQTMPDASVLNGNTQDEIQKEIDKWRQDVQNRVQMMDDEAKTLYSLVQKHITSEVGLDILMPAGGQANMLGIYKTNGRL